MKQCPKCNFTCEDSDIICKNCGYLFNVTGYGPSDTPNAQNGDQQAQGNYGQPYNNQQQGYGNSQQNYGPSQQQPNPYGQQPPYQDNSYNNPYNPPVYNNTYPQNNGYVEQKNDGMAIASLVLGILSCVCCGAIAGILAIIFGFISRSKIAQSNNTLKGSGMSLAGIILGFISIGFTIIYISLWIAGAVNPYAFLNTSSAY